MLARPPDDRMSCVSPGAKVDDLGHGLSVIQTDQDVGRFEVTANDSLLGRDASGLRRSAANGAVLASDLFWRRALRVATALRALPAEQREASAPAELARWGA